MAEPPVTKLRNSIGLCDLRDWSCFKTDTIDLVARSKLSVVRHQQVTNLLLAQGGVLVRAGDEVIIAIGVSGAGGGDIDGEAANSAAYSSVALYEPHCVQWIRRL